MSRLYATPRCAVCGLRSVRSISREDEHAVNPVKPIMPVATTAVAMRKRDVFVLLTVMLLS